MDTEPPLTDPTNSSDPAVGDVVTVTYDAPGNITGTGVAAGIMYALTSDTVYVRAPLDHSSILIPRRKVLRIEHRDPSFPQFT